MIIAVMTGNEGMKLNPMNMNDRSTLHQKYSNERQIIHRNPNRVPGNQRDTNNQKVQFLWNSTAFIYTFIFLFSLCCRNVGRFKRRSDTNNRHGQFSQMFVDPVVIYTIREK